VSVSGANDTEPPFIKDVRATTDAGTVGNVDNGDVHRFNFSEPMARSTGAAGTKDRISDADGIQVDIACGTNANCSPQTMLNGRPHPRPRSRSIS
jgi:hypothetical protein